MNEEQMKCPEVPISTVDVPLNIDSSEDTSIVKENRDYIKEMERKHQRKVDDFKLSSAKRILWAVLFSLVLMWIVDTVVINVGWRSSELLSTIFEFGKYAATTLLGFLFADYSNRNKD